MVNNTTIESEGRLPPQNIEAEQSVLGCLMLDKESIIKIGKNLIKLEKKLKEKDLK